MADSSSGRVVTYTKHGSDLAASEFLVGLWRYRHFIRAYAWAEVRERFLRSRLGLAWLLLNPLLLAATYTLLLVVLRGGEDPQELMAAITSGLFFFLFLRDSIVAAANSLTKAASLLLSSDLPKAAMPIASTVASLMAFGVAALTYIPFHIWASRYFGPRLLLVVPLMAVAFVFAVGMAMFFAFVAARVRDLLPLLPYALRLLLYLSPVLFTLDQLRAAIPRALGPIIWINPFVPYLDTWHRILTGVSVRGERWLVMAAWAIAFTAVGLWVSFKRQHSIGTHL